MDEVCQMIEGKSSSIGHEPSGVQIVFEPSGAMALHDEDGEFIREEPKVIETEPHHDEEGPLQPNDVGEVEELRGALQKANEQIAALQLEVENLKAQVSQGKQGLKRYGIPAARSSSSMMKNWQQKIEK